MTLHQLRIFWAVSQAATLTKASKQLGLAQPSLSQQLSKLEEALGVKLFERTHNQMILTDAGRFLLRKVQFILNDVDEAEAGLQEFSRGVRGIVRIAGLNSVIRVLLPEAMALLRSELPRLEIDVHEAAPAETLELLYGRHVNIGLIASDSVAQTSVSFKQIPVLQDPYVFAVPSAIKLGSVKDPEKDLSAEQREVLNNCIQFSFGTQHTRRVEQWYQRVLPRHRLIVQCRSYEVALGMVRAGLGVCLVPAMTAIDIQGEISGVDLYATDQPDRQVVAVMPAQYLRVEPYKSLLDALKRAGRALKVPAGLPTPPFIEATHSEREVLIDG